MKKFIPYLSFLLLAGAGIYNLLPEKPVDTGRKDKQDEIAKAWAWEAFLTSDPALGYVPSERLLTAMQIKEQRLQQMLGMKTNGAVPGIEWDERGPNNVGGRTRALMFDLSDSANGYKKVWAGSVSGGLWVTNNITATPVVWNKVNDLFENLAITAIAQNPLNRNELYFATGEGQGNIDAVRGFGIFKSTDGGINWTRLASTANFRYINALVIDRHGNLLAGVESYGIQRSTNGGTTWTKVAGSSGQNGGDIEIAVNGDIYASLTGGSNGIMRSRYSVSGTNTGNTGTWQDITPNASGTIAGQNSTWNRIEMSIAPSNASIVYALFAGYSNGSSNCLSIQRYNSTSNTWSVKASSTSATSPIPKIIDQGSNSPFTRGQAWYDLAIAVNPLDEDMVYIGGVDGMRSDNGGTNWYQKTTWSLYNAPGFTSAHNVHADHHAYVFAPGSANRMLMGTDGGIYYSENANSDLVDGKPTWVAKNNGYNVTQFYGGAISPTVTNYMLAGAQDNGTQKFTMAGNGSTSTATGGDGGFCHIDRTDHNVQITSYIYNQYRVSTNGGLSFTNRNFNTNGGFINPTDYDAVGKKLYCGDDGGEYLRWNNPATGGNSYDLVTVAAFNGAMITTVSVSPSVANRVYFGLSNGSVVRVDNAHTGTYQSGTLIKPVTGYNSVSKILIDPNNEDRMLVTYYNYGIYNIYYTEDAQSGAASWQICDGNLPDMPVRSALFDPRDPDMVIIGTELGVWSTDNLNGISTNWQPTNSGLANVKVNQLLYRASDRTLMAVTHGRGVFTATVPTTVPVTWVSVAASAFGETNRIEWIVDNEINLKEYNVQARQPNGSYKVIASLKPKNGQGQKHYQHVDYSFDRKEAKQYYRIQQTDLDGKQSYSKEVVVSRNIKPGFVDYVTNTKSELVIKMNVSYQGRPSAAVYDMNGRILATSVLVAGANSINISRLGSGTYILVIRSAKEDYTWKFVK